MKTFPGLEQMQAHVPDLRSPFRSAWFGLFLALEPLGKFIKTMMAGK